MYRPRGTAYTGDGLRTGDADPGRQIASTYYTSEQAYTHTLDRGLTGQGPITGPVALGVSRNGVVGASWQTGLLPRSLPAECVSLAGPRSSRAPGV